MVEDYRLVSGDVFLLIKVRFQHPRRVRAFADCIGVELLFILPYTL